VSWIRADQVLADSPPVLHLQAVLGLSKAAAIGHVMLLRWWCVDHAPDGDLRGRNDAVLALAAGSGGGATPGEFVAALVGAGILEREPYFRVADWWDVAGPYLQARHKRTPAKWGAIREAYRNSTGTVPEQYRSCTGVKREIKKEKEIPPVSPRRAGGDDTENRRRKTEGGKVPPGKGGTNGTANGVARRSGRRVSRSAEHDQAVSDSMNCEPVRGWSEATQLLWRLFCDERGKRGKWLSRSAAELTLQKLRPYEEAVVAETLREAVANGYQGVFPAKHAAGVPGVAAVVGAKSGAGGRKRWA